MAKKTRAEMLKHFEEVFESDPKLKQLVAERVEAVTRPKGYNAENRTDYVLSDGSTQVMEAVLAERKALTTLKGKARMEAAHRLRAGMIGVLQSCLCDYPLERYDTKSGHHESCSGHRIFLSVMAAKESTT